MGVAEYLEYIKSVGRVTTNIADWADQMGIGQPEGGFGNDLYNHVLSGWAKVMSVFANAKWAARMASGIECQMQTDAAACSHAAIADCELCGRPICLDHGMFSSDATGICYACFQAARPHVKRWEPPRPRKRRPQQAEQVGNLEDDYALFGIVPNCTDDELRRAFRKFQATYHPDTAAGDANRARMNEAVFKSGQRAFQRIVTARGLR